MATKVEEVNEQTTDQLDDNESQEQDENAPPLKLFVFSELNKVASTRAGADLVPFVGKQIVVFVISKTMSEDNKKIESITGEIQEWDAEKETVTGERLTISFPKRVYSMIDRVMTAANGGAVLTNVVDTERGVSIN